MMIAGALAGIVFLAVTLSFSGTNFTPAVIAGGAFLVGSAAVLALDQDGI
jgi:hypothetical protein